MTAGQVLVLPADVVRRISTGDVAAEALVCMPSEGRAYRSENPDERIVLPWAE